MSITNKLNQIKSNDTNENNNPVVSKYDNIYLVSSINGWNATEEYKLKKIAENTYSVEITARNIESDSNGNYIRFKFNNGGSDYSIIDWTIDPNTGQLLLQKGSSYRHYGVKDGDKLTITINVSTLEVNIKKN